MNTPNTTLPNVTMHLPSICLAVKIANDILQADGGGRGYAIIPTPTSLDHRTIGNMGKVIRENMVKAGVGAKLEIIRAYRSDINQLFSRLDSLLTGGLPSALSVQTAPTSTKSTSGTATTTKRKRKKKSDKK